MKHLTNCVRSARNSKDFCQNPPCLCRAFASLQRLCPGTFRPLMLQQAQRLPDADHAASSIRIEIIFSNGRQSNGIDVLLNHFLEPHPDIAREALLGSRTHQRPVQTGNNRRRRLSCAHDLAQRDLARISCQPVAASVAARGQQQPILVQGRDNLLEILLHPGKIPLILFQIKHQPERITGLG